VLELPTSRAMLATARPSCSIFSSWRPSAILDLWSAFGSILRVLGGLYHLTKFSWNPLSSFCNMKIWIFCVFGKCLFTPLKLGFFGNLTPLNREQHQCNCPIAHPCVESRCMMYRSLKSVHWCDLCTWLSDQKKKDNDPNSSKLGIRPDHPRCRMRCGLHGGWSLAGSS